MVDYDALERAGHDLTMIHGPAAGVSSYYCENCGALIQVKGLELHLFHTPRGSGSTQETCERPKQNPEIVSYWERLGYPQPPNLKQKLKKLSDEDFERMKDV